MGSAKGPLWQPGSEFRRSFPTSRSSRDRYKFDDVLFSVRGNVMLSDFRAARLFAHRMNEKRDLVRFPETAVKASQVNAMALIHELSHLMIAAYRQQQNPDIFAEALEYVDKALDPAAVSKTQIQFEEDFPAPVVYRGEVTADTFLESETDGDPNREVALEEMLLLWLVNNNPACAPYVELFDHSPLEKGTVYDEIIEGIETFLAGQPGFGDGGESLFDMLRAPALASPHSLRGQLEFVRQKWGLHLGKNLYRLLSGLDLIAEEEKASFTGPGPAMPPDFTNLDVEPERFSEDLDWMPKVVMIAKNAYVWLDQISKQHEVHVHRLDQIPDEELDELAERGFTTLWLIGLWERSKASRRIKQMMGNDDAVASAYSLFDYVIADDLGGHEAYGDLKERAWSRGIRLASDMVPNHVGVDGKWVIEHPDWFVQLRHSPFPAYSFNGVNLCDDSRVGIYLDDNYYNRTDAAVVFKRVDHFTGDTRFIYHGNDGTTMPWNDTAQLNYLNAEVREAVIQTILHVARMFPVIRFDAAMTLAKKHYQRLWYPEPGSGGDIPSRAEFGMTKADFDAAFPAEFWRDVVDRVQAEVPDTLLLAEAFWFMEGYFVRSLGMHRVYNSAFMNMLKNEDNEKYRIVIKHTLEFDPEILKRYVNFMNNPDEDTAVAQFGKDDKYFGAAVLLSTLPGLPMFGHGQIEGYTEKYGMEYRRAYWDETPDLHLVERHQREICPLLHKRYIFAEVRDFLLYDFFDPSGGVNENVFAYSNSCGEERGLVIYHNKWAEARGWIRASAAFAVKQPDGEKQLHQKNLADGLALPSDEDAYVVFRDSVSGLEYIRNCRELHERGMYVELGSYKYHVFMDFRVVRDSESQPYGKLAVHLSGVGVSSIDEAMTELFLEPIHGPFKKLVNADTFRRLMAATSSETEETETEETEGVSIEELTAETQQHLASLFGALKEFVGSVQAAPELATEVVRELEAALTGPVLRVSPSATTLDSSLLAGRFTEEVSAWGTLLGWIFTHSSGKIVATGNYAEVSRSWMDEWLFGRILARTMQDLGLDAAAASHVVATVKWLVSHQRWFDPASAEGLNAHNVLHNLLRDEEVQRYLQINRHEEILWFNQESFEELCGWLLLVGRLDAEVTQNGSEAVATVATRTAVIDHLIAAANQSEFQVEKLLDAARHD